MGSTSLLVFAALAGYLFTEKSYRYKFVIAREDGQRFYLRSVLVGIPFVALSSLISHLLFYLPTVYPNLLTFTLNETESIVAIGSGSVMISLACCIGYNFYLGEAGKKKKFKEAMYTNDYDLILYDSMDNLHLITVVLENRKAYVGIIYDGLEPSSKSSYLTIVPIFSGFRDSETLNLKLLSTYTPVQQTFVKMLKERGQSNDPHSEEQKKNALENLLPCNDYKLAIPREKIINLYKFNAELYNQIQEQFEEQDSLVSN